MSLQKIIQELLLLGTALSPEVTYAFQWHILEQSDVTAHYKSFFCCSYGEKKGEEKRHAGRNEHLSNG
jgi:hypothetical protein